MNTINKLAAFAVITLSLGTTQVFAMSEADMDSAMNTTKMQAKDSYITVKVKSVFIKEKLFGEEPIAVMSIKVETKNGVVYLTGTAESKHQEETAIKLAESVDGVKKVVSKVTIKR